MANELSVNGTKFETLTSAFAAGGGVTCALPKAGNYYALEPWGRPPMETFRDNEAIDWTFPGEDHVGRKILGRRTRVITATLVFIGVDRAAAEGAAATAMDAFVQDSRYTVTLPGGTQRQGCVLESANQIEYANGGTNRIYVAVNCVWRQLSLTN